ncbi:MAG: pilus assembly PilX family protein [Candidatus Competibacteraceae bacterium]
MKPRFYLKNHSQRGAVLIVGLLILLIMTIVGVTAMQSTGLEEKMAGNVRDRNVALQAAESALRQAEDYIEPLATVSGFNGTNGLYGLNNSEPIDLSKPASTVWTTTNSRAFSGTLDGVSTVPRYMIKIRSQGNSSLAGALNVQGYGKENPASQAVIFRITARGTGGTDQSQVFLQSYYGKLF